MIVDLDDGYTYIPKWNGNKDLDEKDQVKVHMEYASGAKQTSEFNKRGLTIEDIENHDQKYYVFDFCLICKKIDNLYYKKGDKKVAATPEDVASLPGFDELYREIKQDYANRTEVSSKN